MASIDVAMQSTSEEILEKVNEGVNFNFPTAYAGAYKYATQGESYNITGKGIAFATYRDGGEASFAVDGNSAFTLGNAGISDATNHFVYFNQSCVLKSTKSSNGGVIGYVLYE